MHYESTLIMQYLFTWIEQNWSKEVITDIKF